MSDIPADRPTTIWSLTAPESYVLLRGPAASSTEALRLALLELVARGVLRLVGIEERDRLGRQRQRAVLTPGPQAGAALSEPLASTWLLVMSTPLRTHDDGTVGMPLAAVVQTARRHYGRLSRFVAETVMPCLIDRYLYEQQRYRYLWIWPATRTILTPAGARLRHDLRHRLELSDARLAGWVEQEPERAAAFVEHCGAAVLLMTPLFPALTRLSERYLTGAHGQAGNITIGSRPLDLLRNLFSSQARSVVDASLDLAASGEDERAHHLRGS